MRQINGRTNDAITGFFTIATLFAVLCLPSAAAAQSEHDAERCDAYFTLARCDRDECIDECYAKNSNDQRGIEVGVRRCDRKFKRQLKRPNRKYDCGFDTCELDVFERRLDKARLKLMVCEARNEIEQLGEEHLEQCMVECNMALVDLWTLAAENNCEDLALPWDCAAF